MRRQGILWSTTERVPSISIECIDLDLNIKGPRLTTSCFKPHVVMDLL